VAAEISSIAETNVAATTVAVSRTEVIVIGYPLGILSPDPTIGPDAMINAGGVPIVKSRYFSVRLMRHRQIVAVFIAIDWWKIPPTQLDVVFPPSGWSTWPVM
jgi:hypothetical protein